MKLLVTGATGFVGTVLVPKLVSAYGAHLVSVFLLPDDSFPEAWRNQGVTCYRGNVLEPDSILAACAGHTHVIHLAGMISYWKQELDQIMAVNRDGVQHVVDACLAAGVQRLVHISSVGAIGFEKDGTLADELTPYNWPPLFCYMESKHEGQKIVEQAVQKRGLEAIILNPASIMGPGDMHIETPHNQIYKRVYGGLMVGSFSGGLAVVDVRDLCEIIIKSLTMGSTGRRYLVVGANVTYQEVLRQIGYYARRTVLPFRVPGFVLSVAGLLLELVSSITGRKPLLTYAYGRLSSWKTYYSNQLSAETFDHTYRSFSDTIRDSCAFFEEHFARAERER